MYLSSSDSNSSFVDSLPAGLSITPLSDGIALIEFDGGIVVGVGVVNGCIGHGSEPLNHSVNTYLE